MKKIIILIILLSFSDIFFAQVSCDCLSSKPTEVGAVINFYEQVDGKTKHYYWYTTYKYSEPYCIPQNLIREDGLKPNIKNALINAVKRDSENYKTNMTLNYFGIIMEGSTKDAASTTNPEKVIYLSNVSEFNSIVRGFQLCSQKGKTNLDKTESNKSSNSSYKYSTSTESIYEKRQRESRAQRNKEQEENRRKQKVLDNLQQQQNKSYQKLQQASNNLGNIITQMQNSAAFNKARNEQIHRQKILEKKQEQEAYEREQKRKNEIKLRKIEEEKRKIEEQQRIREEKKRKENAQSYFIRNIKDHKMPLIVKQKEVFFFIINKNYYYSIIESGIAFSPFSLKTNNNMQLPYKNKVIAKYINLTKKTKPMLYGPYYSQKEQLQKINELKTKARGLDIKIIKDVPFQFKQQNIEQKTKNSDVDFWGNKKEKTSSIKKKTTEKDFWNK